MTPNDMRRLQELALEPILPLQSDHELLRRAHLELTLVGRTIDRLALCSEHRGVSQDSSRCAVCDAEKRGAQLVSSAIDRRTP